MASATTLFRTRVPKARLRKAEKVLGKLGLKPGDAVNMFFAQLELRGDMPFAVTTHPQPLLTVEEQAKSWNDSLGQY